MTKFDLTADAVIFKKIESQYHVLLIKRKNKPFKSCWALPGGFVDEGELVSQAAHRELFEETSLLVNFTPADFVFYYDAIYRDPRKRIITFVFTKLILSNEKLKANDDAKETVWMKLLDLPELAFDHQQLINDAVKHLNLEL